MADPRRQIGGHDHAFARSGLSLITGSSSILYVPDSLYCGVDTFAYTIHDSNGESFCRAIVTISITGTVILPTASTSSDVIIIYGSGNTSSPSTNSDTA